MSVSVFVSAVRDLDDKFAKMMAVKHSCEAAGVEYPEELTNYFGDNVTCDEDFLRKEMSEANVKYDLGVSVGDVEYGDGMEIDLEQLPPEFKKLRIYMG